MPYRSGSIARFINRILSGRRQPERDEYALKEVQDWYRKAQTIGHKGHWELNMRNHRISWSDEVYRSYNLTDKTPVDYDTCLSLIHPDDRPRLLKALDDTLAGIAPFDIVHRIVHRTGAIRYVHALGSCWRLTLPPISKMSAMPIRCI